MYVIIIVVSVKVKHGWLYCVRGANIITVLPCCYALLAVTPRPPIFGKNYCIGLFYLHYTPPSPCGPLALEPVCGTAHVRMLQV